MEDIFSPSHDMAEDVGSGGKLLGEQDFTVETWTVIGEVGWCSYSKLPIK